MLPSRKSWIDAEKEKVDEYVENIVAMSDKLAKLGSTFNDTNTSNALSRIEDALPLQIAPNLTPTEHKAAMLVGKGLSFDEAERALGVPPGTIYSTHQRVPEFRRTIEYYQMVDEEEVGGRARQEIKMLLDDNNLDDKVRVSLIALAQKIGMMPHQRRMDIADRILKKESIDATKEAYIHPGRLIGVRVEEPVDADWEVVTDK